MKMKSSLFIILVLLVFVKSPLLAQNQQQFSISAYSLHPVEEAMNDIGYQSFFANKLYYQGEIADGLYGILGIGLKRKMIEDICEHCADAFNGSGQFNKVQLELGVLQEIPIEPQAVSFIGAVHFYYASGKYDSQFSGGFVFRQFERTEESTEIGAFGQVGVAFYFTPNLNAMVLTSVAARNINRRGTDFQLGVPNTSYEIANFGLLWLPLEVRVGFGF